MKPTDIHSGLTAEFVREIFSYDPETGILIRKKLLKGCNRKAGTIAGHKNRCGYINVRIGQRGYLAHRLVWLHFYGEWPANEIDHRNGVKDDNRLANLRDVSRQVNMQNQRKAQSRAISSPFSTGLLGTYFEKDKQRFIAAITDPVTRKKKKLGRFLTAADAHAAYLKEKRRIHLGCMI